VAQDSGYNIYYGYSNDASGTSWVAPIMVPGMTGTSDYPSIGVDASGRIIIGSYSGGYHVSLSNNAAGTSFTSAQAITNLPSGDTGASSRVVATSSKFELFLPYMPAPANTISRVDRMESSDGISWIAQASIDLPGQPQNQSPSSNYCGGSTCGSIFYAPYLDAKGFTDGRWVVVFPVNNGGYNNIFIASSDRGNGLVNSYADDQFLGAVATSSDGGYWVNYYTFSDSNRNLPLIEQAIYIPPGASPIGATTSPAGGISPTSWDQSFSASRGCPTPCFSAGDYNGISSNPYASASTPYTMSGSTLTSLWQSFVQDPAVSNLPTFTPNYLSFPIGADLTYLAGPISPTTYAASPTLTHGSK